MSWRGKKGYFPFFLERKKSTQKSPDWRKHSQRWEHWLKICSDLPWLGSPAWCPQGCRGACSPGTRWHFAHSPVRWLNWAGLWMPSASAWGWFLCFDLAQCLTQRRSTLNIYVINEWMECLRIGMEENEGINTIGNPSVSYEKPFFKSWYSHIARIIALAQIW